MTTQPPDPLIERMRAADRVASGPGPTDADIDRALAGLLSRARGEPRATPRLRRAVVPSLAAVVAAAAVMVILLSPFGSASERLNVQQTRMILRGAAAGLAVSPGAVLHTTAVGEELVDGDRVVARWRVQEWLGTSRPYDVRAIFSPTHGQARETAMVDGRLQLYDPQRDTVYTGQAPPTHTLRSLGGGRYRLTEIDATRATTISAAQVRALRDGRDTLTVYDGRPVLVPYSALESQPLNVRVTALSLIHSPHPHVRRGVTFNGRAAIEVFGTGVIPTLRNEYYVAPHTYAPLGLIQRLHGTTSIERFTTYRLLPGTVANRSLVTLPGAHPQAKINNSPTAWNAAADRLFR